MAPTKNDNGEREQKRAWFLQLNEERQGLVKKLVDLAGEFIAANEDYNRVAGGMGQMCDALKLPRDKIEMWHKSIDTSPEHKLALIDQFSRHEGGVRDALKSAGVDQWQDDQE